MARFKIEYGGEILFDEELFDAEYTSSLEAQNAAQSDIISDLNTKIAELEEEMGRVKGMLDDVEAILDADDDAPPTDDPAADWALSPADNVQSYIEDGAYIVLSAGVYNQTLDFSGVKGVTIEAAPGHNVVFSSLAFPDFEFTYNEADDTYSAPYPGYAGLWQHDDPASDFNTARAYPLLAVIDTEPLIWKVGGVTLDPGEFWVDSPADQAGTIYVRLQEHQSIDNFRVATAPRLVWGDENTENITLRYIDFQGCSNTSFTGAVNTPGSGWFLDGVNVSLANTIGIELGQGGEKSDMRSQVTDSTFNDVTALDCGQMGWWGSAKDSSFHACGHTGSNWKGFDHQWHASHKFENTHNCIFNGWYASECNGPGFWFDGVGGGNTGNTLTDPTVTNCVRTGIELELGTSDNVITGAVINGIDNSVTNPGSGWNQSTGFMVKANSNNNIIENAVIKNSEKGIWIDNTDPRGVSDHNTFTNTTYESVEQNVMIVGENLNNST